MKKNLILVSMIMTVLLILMSGLSGCATNKEKLVVVLDWTINTNHTGLYVAMENGYFKDEGLEVEIQAPPQTGAALLVAAGTAQFGISYQEEVTYSRAADIPLVAVAAIIQNNTSGFASRKSAQITSPADFENKRYGGWDSPVEEAMLKALMEKYGADYQKLKIVSLGDMDFFAATERDADFTWVFEGWDGVAARLKGIDINYIALGQEEPALNYYTPVIITNETYIEENAEKVERFLKAVAKGYDFAVAQPQEAGEILLKYAPELDRELVMASQEYLAGQYKADAPRWGEMKAQVWKAYAAWLYERDLLEVDIDTDAAFTNKYLP